MKMISTEQTNKINKEIKGTTKLLEKLTESEWQRVMGYLEGIIASKTA